MGRDADGGIHGCGIDNLPRAGAAVQFGQRALGQVHPRGRARNGDAVATAGQPDIKSTFKMQEMTVVIPHKLRQKRVILKLQGYGAVIRRSRSMGGRTPPATATGGVERGLCLFSQALSVSSVRTPPSELV
ncbi:hypothetical protein AA16373_0141 [Komagataeibacter swingsii DSM 16373]|nr:hypothetical protein AA16373_0141 [Komagataeibacter swingsii DSM 16373]